LTRRARHARARPGDADVPAIATPDALLLGRLQAAPSWLLRGWPLWLWLLASAVGLALLCAAALFPDCCARRVSPRRGIEKRSPAEGLRALASQLLTLSMSSFRPRLIVLARGLNGRDRS